MTETLILITLYENTPYFSIFPSLKPLGGIEKGQLLPSPCGAAPECIKSAVICFFHRDVCSKPLLALT